MIARTPALLPLLRGPAHRDIAVADWLMHLVRGPVTRHELPGIGAFNFVCEQALDGGGMASLRNDPLGKGMAQIPVHAAARAAGPAAGTLEHRPLPTPGRPPWYAIHSTTGDTHEPEPRRIPSCPSRRAAVGALAA